MLACKPKYLRSISWVGKSKQWDKQTCGVSDNEVDGQESYNSCQKMFYSIETNLIKNWQIQQRTLGYPMKAGKFYLMILQENILSFCI